MYSALPGDEPYPQQPYISKTTRSDFSGKFICLIDIYELDIHR